MKIDLHCHSKYSYDSYLEPEAIIEQAIENGLDGVCFMEHHSIDASKPVERIKVPDEFTIFRGAEVSTFQGHLLIFGLKDDSWNLWHRNNYLDLTRVIERVYELGVLRVLR